MDLLSDFLPNRDTLSQLTSRGIMHPQFISADFEEAQLAKQQEKYEMVQNLEHKLDPNRRPSIVQVAQQGLIPEQWMVDLYGLADDVRKKHKRFESAVTDLKSQLNVPPILADVVATDVLTEMEMVDQQLDHSGTGTIMDMTSRQLLESNMEPKQQNMNMLAMNGNIAMNDHHRHHDDDDDDDEERPSGRRGSNEEDQSVWWRKQIEDLRREIAGKEEAIGALRAKNGDLEREMERMKEMEHGHLSMTTFCVFEPFLHFI